MGGTSFLNDTASGGYLIQEPSGTWTKVPGSKGNRILADATAGVAAGTFCFRVENSDGTRNLYYDSDKGGINATGCA